jgi:hypothetical protein
MAATVLRIACIVLFLSVIAESLHNTLVSTIEPYLCKSAGPDSVSSYS